jgi:hypothetical protein
MTDRTYSTDIREPADKQKAPDDAGAFDFHQEQ